DSRRPQVSLKLPQRVELCDITGSVDPHADNGGLFGLQRAGERIAEGLFGFDRHAIGAERLRELFPIDATERDAVAWNTLDLLLDANEPDLAVVEHDHDDRQVLDLRGLQFRN